MVRDVHQRDYFYSFFFFYLEGLKPENRVTLRIRREHRGMSSLLLLLKFHRLPVPPSSHPLLLFFCGRPGVLSCCLIYGSRSSWVPVVISHGGAVTPLLYFRKLGHNLVVCPLMQRCAIIAIDHREYIGTHLPKSRLVIHKGPRPVAVKLQQHLHIMSVLLVICMACPWSPGTQLN